MAGADLPDDPLRDLNMLMAMRIGAVDHLYQKVCLGHLLEGRFKGLDKRGGKLMNKADRIGKQKFLPPCRGDTPDGRIQGGKEHIRFKDLPLIRLAFRCRIGGIPGQHRVHDRGFTGIGISHKRYQGQSGFLSLLALCRPLAADALQLPGQFAEPVIYGAAVDFQLGLTFSLGGHGTGGAALTVLSLPHADQPGL